jgi:hypothetical protein
MSSPRCLLLALPGSLMLLFFGIRVRVRGFAQLAPTPSSERELLQESEIIVKFLSPSRLLLAAVMGVALVSAGVSPASAAPVADQTQSGASIGLGRVVFGPSGGPPPEGLGSQFTAGVSGQLTQIDIPVDAAVANGNFLGVQVSVYSVDSFGVPTGGPLAVQNVPGAGIQVLASGGTLSVVFSTPATVAAGTPYAFVVEVLGATGEDTFIGLDWVAAAPDKLGIQTINYVPAVLPSMGIAFTTYVDGAGTPPGGGGGSGGEELADTGFAPSVPLAVAFAMLVAGAALVVSRRTRRQHSTALGG